VRAGHPDDNRQVAHGQVANPGGQSANHLPLSE
jgi:hypothetical protein